MAEPTLKSLQAHFEALQKRVEELEARWKPSIALVAVLVATVGGLTAWQATAQSSINDLEGKVAKLEAPAPPPPETTTTTTPEETTTTPTEETTTPEPEPAACTSTANSVSAIAAGLGTGKTVCLADGTYGGFSVKGPGTVRAQHAGAATVGAVTLEGTGAALEYVNTTGQVTVAPGSSGAVVAHDKITGGYFGVDACPSSTTTCTNFKVLANRFVGPFGEDAIRLNRYQGALIEGNEISGVRENGNHSDCLQTVWTGNDLTFRKNYLHDNRCQGFFVKDQNSLCGSGSGVCGPVNGIKVEDNLFLRDTEPCAPTHEGCGQPLYFQVFGPYTGLVISHNTLWANGPTGGTAALREGIASDTVINANVIYRLWTDSNASGATMTNNTRCVLEGTWPSSRPGEEVVCNPAFARPSADDYRLPNGRGVDWAPEEQHYGP